MVVVVVVVVVVSGLTNLTLGQVVAFFFIERHRIVRGEFAAKRYFARMYVKIDFHYRTETPLKSAFTGPSYAPETSVFSDRRRDESTSESFALIVIPVIGVVFSPSK